MFTRSVLKRAYHSIQHANPETTSQITTKILSNALDKYVPTYGFKEIALLNSSKDFQYNTSSILSIFENDPVDSLIHYNLTSKRLALAGFQKELADDNKSIMLRNLITKRLELNQPILQHYSSALSNMILPHNFTKSMDELLKLSDEFYYLINDQSNDFSWYSKRLTIATVYIQCELHMLQQSDFNKTINFMKGKLDELDTLGEAYNNFEEYSIFTMMSTINLIKSQLARG